MSSYTPLRPYAHSCILTIIQSIISTLQTQGFHFCANSFPLIPLWASSQTLILLFNIYFRVPNSIRICGSLNLYYHTLYSIESPQSLQFCLLTSSLGIWSSYPHVVVISSLWLLIILNSHFDPHSLLSLPLVSDSVYVACTFLLPLFIVTWDVEKIIFIM